MIITLLNSKTGNYEHFALDELYDMLNDNRGDDWLEYNDDATIQEIVECIDTLCDSYSTDVNKEEMS